MACQSEADFHALLTIGIYPQGSDGTNPLKASYLELFAPNILAFPNAVHKAHYVLLQGKFVPDEPPPPKPTSTPTPTTMPGPVTTPTPKDTSSMPAVAPTSQSTITPESESVAAKPTIALEPAFVTAPKAMPKP